MFVERFAGGSVPTHSLVSSALLQPPRSPPPAAPPPAAPVHRALLAPARLLEACLHSLLSFLTSNFPSNPLLPDSLFSIERPSLRFYKPPIFTEEQVRPLRVFMRLASPTMLKSKPRRIPQRPARGPQDASTRTPERPAQGPQDTQREDPTTPSARTHPFTMCIVPPSWIWPKSSPRILRGTLDTWTWTHAPGTLQL
ncbi:ESX-1 secretion-associated protein EspI-like isoform X3 [Onychomys torridus]|uniref:ESX-1 secretion-associated protein EspI-like isoform X3 n=1 Tax=Onychomys torridus TaxID=38674 RepID=UPI00167F24BF|nr:ESX-1 secretion-associated protein EspI-like isoform X3 [Onychomys torridus]